MNQNQTLKNAANKYGFNNYSGSLQDNYKLGQFLLGANQPKPVEVNTKIKANEIGNPISFPTYPTPSPSPLSTIGDITLGKIESNQAQAQQDQQFAVDAAKEAKDENFFKSAILNIFNKQADLGNEAAGIRAKEGVGEKRKEVTRLENEIKAKKLAYERQIQEREKNKSGSFGGAVEQDVANIQREGNRELADLAIQYEAASGNYKDAYDIAEAKVRDMTQGLEDQLKALQVGYQFYQDDMTESQKVAAQQNFQLLQAQKDFEYNKQLAAYKSYLDAEQKITTGNVGAPPGGYQSDLDAIIGATLSTIPTKFGQQTFNSQILKSRNDADKINLIASQVLKGAPANIKTDFVNQTVGINELDKAISLIDQGVQTGLLQNAAQYTYNLAGKDFDPKLAQISGYITAAIQPYRNSVTGAAWGAQEEQEYQSLFGSTKFSPQELRQRLVQTRELLKDKSVQGLNAFVNPLGSFGNPFSEYYGSPVTQGEEEDYTTWLKANGFNN